MFKYILKLRRWLKRKMSLENWAFLIPSFNRLNRDFLFMFKYELAKRCINNTELKPHLDMITSLAQESLKAALFTNAKEVKKL